MSSLTIMIILIALIITTSKIIMNYLRQQDIKNGLVIKEEYYTIGKTLSSSGKQKKRMEEMKKKNFSDFEISTDMWKRTYILILILSGAGVITGVITKFGIGTVLLMTIFSSITYFQKNIRMLTVMDILTLISILFSQRINISLMIILPSMILFNYIIWTDYHRYRKEIRQHQIK